MIVARFLAGFFLSGLFLSPLPAGLLGLFLLGLFLSPMPLPQPAQVRPAGPARKKLHSSLDSGVQEPDTVTGRRNDPTDHQTTMTIKHTFDGLGPGCLASYVLHDERDASRLAILNVWYNGNLQPHVVLAFGPGVQLGPGVQDVPEVCSYASLIDALAAAMRVLDANDSASM